MDTYNIKLDSKYVPLFGKHSIVLLGLSKKIIKLTSVQIAVMQNVGLRNTVYLCAFFHCRGDEKERELACLLVTVTLPNRIELKALLGNLDPIKRSCIAPHHPRNLYVLKCFFNWGPLIANHPNLPPPAWPIPRTPIKKNNSLVQPHSLWNGTLHW